LRGPSVVFATPAGERHEIGLQMVAVAALGAGASPVYLGADLPADALADAAVRTGAVAVALSIITLPAEAAFTEISSARDALPGRVQLWVGGACAHRLDAIDAVEFIATLDEFERRVVLLGYESE
jgi:methanogenic corrinoid protein MtbC1